MSDYKLGAPKTDDSSECVGWNFFFNVKLRQINLGGKSLSTGIGVTRPVTGDGGVCMCVGEGVCVKVETTVPNEI